MWRLGIVLTILCGSLCDQFAQAGDPALERRRPAPDSQSEAVQHPIAHKSQQHVDYACQLASRGAVFSAKAELAKALALVAQARDLTESTSRYSRSLQAGLRALDAAAEFAPGGQLLNSVADCRRLRVTHQTILEGVDLETCQILDILQAYCATAQVELSRACGDEPAAARALCALGRLYSLTPEQGGISESLHGAGAMALFQTALCVDPDSFEAANELEVHLARVGRLDAARGALELSVSLRSKRESWANLATVYERLGLTQQAAYARSQQESIVQAGAAHQGTAPVRWVSAEHFTSDSGDFLEAYSADAAAASQRPQDDLRNVIVLRRDENWNLMAVRLDLHDPLFGRHNLSRSHIWLRDSDIVLLPKSDLLWHGDIVDLIFRRAIYSTLPVNYGINLADLTTI